VRRQCRREGDGLHVELIEGHAFEKYASRRRQEIADQSPLSGKTYEVWAPTSFTDYNDAKAYAREHGVTLFTVRIEGNVEWYPRPKVNCLIPE
jgi:hypothetical protein